MSFTNFYNNQLFKVNFLSIFLNPFYINRKGLMQAFQAQCPKLIGTVLDIGCGRKPYKEYFTKSTSYIGIDIENEGHSHENEDIDVYYDGVNIPFDSNSFDNVFSSEVFEHVEHLEALTKEIIRVLKPNGKLLISTPFVFMEHEMPHDYRRFTKKGLETFLINNNFEILDVMKFPNDVKSMAQLNSAWVYSFTIKMNRYLRILLTIFLISPINITGVLLSKILPNKGIIYSNVVILAQKR